MAFTVLLFAFGVLCSWETRGSTAVTPVFVKQGDDVLLEISKPVELNEEKDFFWKFNNSYSVAKLSHNGKPIIFKNYSRRAEFSAQNYSLLLKNLQHNDSGNYVALVTGERDQIIAEYNFKVQNPVSTVKLSVDPVLNSTGSCNLTVTCSTKPLKISSTFRCDTQTCWRKKQPEPEDTTSGSSFHVYMLNDSIFCNHSNQVSWTTGMKKIQDVCPLNVVPSRGQTIGIGIGIPVFLCLLIGLFII